MFFSTDYTQALEVKFQGLVFSWHSPLIAISDSRGTLQAWTRCSAMSQEGIHYDFALWVHYDTVLLWATWKLHNQKGLKYPPAIK